MKFYDFFKDKNIFTSIEIEQIGDLECGNLPDKKEKILSIITRGKVYKEIFSNYKSLDKFPFNDVEFNERGLHIFRILFSRWNPRYQLAPLAYFINGVLKIENFLENFAIDGLITEIDKIPLSVNKQPFNIIHQLSHEYPHLKFALEMIKKPILNIVNEDSDTVTKYYNNSFVQKIINEPSDNDVQKKFHSDIFFPAIKWWYFPEEVNEGCFTYVPRSTLITDQLLEYYWKQSIAISHNSIEEWRGKDHKEGSFRFSEKEISELGLNPEEQKVKANTLVIGNVFGIHSRGNVENRTQRNAIHGSIRIERPFQ